MTNPHLVYFADPMCSWCWGFSPVISAIEERFGAALPIRLVLGGLRPGADQELSAAERADIRSHWTHVHDASGQPFDFAFFDRPGFVYDTEPASRAVVVLRRHGVEQALRALRHIQAAFYAHNQDVTDAAVLGTLAGELGMDPAEFAREFESEGVRRETWSDFAMAQQAGVRGFPTLIAGSGVGNRYVLITNGFQPADRILSLLNQWQASVAPPAP